MRVLQEGGNALDAAIAVNLTLGVVTPYLCGYGGDLFAMVWDGTGLHCYDGAGRAPAAASVERAREAIGSSAMPRFGPHTVTVPGAVRGWFDLLDRFGSRSFSELAQDALGLARDGFALSEAGAASLMRAHAAYAGENEWRRVYGQAVAGETLIQADLARAISALGARGPSTYYEGEIGEAIMTTLRARGGLLDIDDLTAHRGGWVEPIRMPWGDETLVEMPPPTQGITALEALAIFERAGARDDHTLVEAVKIALADRQAFVTDPSSMTRRAEDLLGETWLTERAARIGPRASASALRSARGGTAYMCAADSSGMVVSLIQSNFAGFGSGVTVPGWGINLHNRGCFFSLDDADANVIAPRKKTMHTLIPAVTLAGNGRPRLAFGTMGGDGQAQTHAQMMRARRFGDANVLAMIDAPRWFVSPENGSVTVESRAADVAEHLRARGHDVRLTRAYDPLMGHAHAIEQTVDGYEAAADPRSEGAALGF